ncbi:hypothetical protein GCM10023231_34980 [Olivibacter ginsenosidimutans]|uniref:Uncharacterized protein n=1 Tax=Olivibacter ginsenosidimutans TaxID=1176537 RepID=A0ABP9C048_9SPHI
MIKNNIIFAVFNSEKKRLNWLFKKDLFTHTIKVSVWVRQAQTHLYVQYENFVPDGQGNCKSVYIVRNVFYLA